MISSDQETDRKGQRRAMSVNDFCVLYGIGRSKFYEEKNAGRLKVHRVGKRLVILRDDAEEWLKNLPAA